jgi:hypothetical protein
MILGFKPDWDKHVPAAVEYSEERNSLIFNRPLKGMRFNLDKHLIAS